MLAVKEKLKHLEQGAAEMWGPELFLSPIFNGVNQWIGLKENLQENPTSNGKIYGYLWCPVDFPLNQSIE